MTEQFKFGPHKWSMWDSFLIFRRCIMNQKFHMYPQVYGYQNDDNMRELFFYYLNYGYTQMYWR